MFKYEYELVDYFIKNLNVQDNILIREMNTRYGNIDVVRINSYELPFNLEQIETLSKPSCSRIFVYLKNKRYVCEDSIINNIGLSKSTLKSSLCELVSKKLIIKNENKFRRYKEFNFPKTTVTGYEAKLTDFKKAYYQAISNYKFVDYSYLVFPIAIAINIEKNYGTTLRESKVGLIGVSTEFNEVIIRANKIYEMSDSIRLLSLSKSYSLGDRVIKGGDLNRNYEY